MWRTGRGRLWGCILLTTPVLTVGPPKLLHSPPPLSSLSGCPHLRQDAHSGHLSFHHLPLSTPSVHSPQGECFKIQMLPLPWPRSPAVESSNSVLEHKGPQPAPDSAPLGPADPSPPSLCLMPFAPVILNHFRFSLFPRAFDTSWTFGIIRPPLFISPRKPSLTSRSS